MAIAQNHVINIQPGVSAPLVIHCSQGDTGTQINLTVVNGDEEFDCSSYACSVHGTRSDRGNWGPVTCNVSGSTVSFSLTSDMTAVAGSCLAEVSIGTVGTANFALLVENATFENGVTYSNDVSVYQNILNAVQAGLSLAEAAVTNEKNERIAAVNAEAATRASADSKLQSQINQIIAPSGEAPSAAEVQNARIGADGVTYDTLGTAIRTQVNNLNNTLDKLEVVTDLYGSIYVNDGYYNNGVYNEGSWGLSKHYDVADCDKITATITTDQYYDIYDFVDDSFKTISYKREEGPSKTIEITLNVPDNARYFVVNGRFVEKTVVKGTFQLKNEQKLHDIKPATVLNGFWNTAKNAFEYSNGYHYSLFDVSSYKRGQIEADAFEYSKSVVLLDESESLIRDLNSGRYFQGNGHYKISVDLEGITYVGVSTTDNKVPIVKVLTKKIEKEQNLFEKSIVWFGTSIPAGGLYGLNNENAYPNRVGKILSANVINEAVGSSAITCKSPDRVSESNPYGFTHDFEGCSRCLTNTVEEMNWIIDHYNDSSIFDYRTVTSLSESDKEFIRSCSYENKLLPYLTTTKCPDLFVFDHGHNDNTNDKKEAYYSETININGSEENGWYSNGVYQDSQYKESIKFDVSNYSQVSLSGTIGAWRDIYDLFDENGRNIGFEKVNVGVSVDCANKEIDVSGAKYLVVSNNNNLLNSVSLKGYKYDRNHNLYCYQGAMRFLLNLIFSFNPKQRVVMIGEYENEKQPYIAKYQNKVADEWNLPIYRQWEEYGWSNNTIKTKWYWNNGLWTLGTKEQTITILNCWLADTVHPHSDTSGKTLQFMADHIANWMKENIFLLN